MSITKTIITTAGFGVGSASTPATQPKHRKWTYRGPPAAVLECVAGLGSREVGGSSSAARISNPVRRTRPPTFDNPLHSIRCVWPGNREEKSSRPRGGQDAAKGGHRTSRFVYSGILQSSLPAAQARRKVASHTGFISGKPVCDTNAIQNGDSSNSHGGALTRRMGDVPGPDGCVFSHTHSGSVSEIPKVPHCQGRIPVPGPTFLA